MAYSSLQFREYLCEQLAIAGTVDLRPMFHSHCVYLDGVAIGRTNDDLLVLRESPEGWQALGPNALQNQDAPGARLNFLIEDLETLRTVAIGAKNAALLACSPAKSRSRRVK